MPEPVEENVDEDDLCPVCQLLLLKPVTTTCNHTLCESCTARAFNLCQGRSPPTQYD